MKMNVVDKLGKEIKSQEVKVFTKANVDLKAVLLSYLHNQKQRTKAAKNRGQVAGSGIKPWRQKGTGRARAGSRQSGLWKGGGVIFAPAYYKTVKKINKKVKLAALKQLLQQKIKDGEVQIVQKISLDKPQTKTIVRLLTNLKLADKKILIISQKPLKNLQLSTRNLAQTSYFPASQINALKLAQHQHILITKKALNWLINHK